MLFICLEQIHVRADVLSTSITVYDSTNSMICQSAQEGESEISNTGSLSTGEKMTIVASLGFQGDDVAQHTIKLYIGNMNNSVLTYFNGGGRVVGETYTKDGITYTVKQEENEGDHIGELYLEITGAAVGGTVGNNISLEGYFLKTAVNGSAWNLTLNVDGEDRENVKVTAESDVIMNNEKSSVNQNVILKDRTGETTIDTDIQYYIKAYTGNTINTTPEELDNGVAAVSEYTITDTITLPDGMYFNVTGTTESEIKDSIRSMISTSFGEINIDSYSTDSGYVNSVTISYKKTNNDTTRQIEDLNGTVTINSNSIKVSENTQSGIITNRLKTSYKVIGSDAEKTTEEVSANVNVNRPTEGAYSDIKKEIEDVADKHGQFDSYWQNNSYLLEGDYVIYKISFKNSGDEALTNISFTDTLPDGLEAVSDFNELNQNSYKYFDRHPNYTINSWNKNAWCNTTGQITDDNNQNVNVATTGKTISFSGATLEGGQTFYGYVLAKVTAMPSGEQNRTISNTVTINGNTVSSDMPQRQKEPEIKIEKTAVKVNNDGTEENVSVYEPGDNIKYYITVRNDGSGDADNVMITDSFPAQVTADKNNIYSTVTGDASVGNYTEETDAATDTDIYKWNVSTLPSGSSVQIVIPARINDDASASILNSASAEYNSTVKTATSELKQKTESTEPSAKVGLKKERTSNSDYVSDGDIVTYRITFNTEDTFTDDSPLIITDNIPDWLSYTSSFTGSNGVNVSADTNTITIRYTGGAGTGYADLTFIVVNSEAYNGISFSNKAEVQGGISAESDTIIVGNRPEAVSTDGLEVSKKAYVMRNNEKVYLNENNDVIESGENVHFEVIVTNTGQNDINRFSLYDKLDGKYTPIYGTIQGTVTLPDNQTETVWMKIGLDNQIYNGDTQENEAYQTAEVEWIFATINEENCVYNNSNFKMRPGESIILEYQVQAAKSFSTGANAVRVNDSGYSAVTYRTMSKLSMNKTADNETVFCDDNNRIEDVTINYTVELKNESFTPYSSSDIYFVDELPDGTQLAESGQITLANTDITDSVEFYTGNDYNPESWSEVTNNGANDGKIIGIKFGSAITIPAGESLIIKYSVKLRQSMIDTLNDEITNNESYDFTPQTLINNVYFHGGEKFELERADGTIITANTITTGSTVTLRSKTSRPLLEKQAYAYMGPNSDSITESSSNADVGAYLIWKIKLTNQSDAQENIENYTITDTLPSGYAYVTENIYTNKQGISYPGALTDNNLNSGKIAKSSVNEWGYVRTELIDYIGPYQSDNTLTWDFSDSKYYLKPGESIEFTFITKPVDADKSGIYTNSAYVEVNDIIYEASDKINASASFALNSVKTSSSKTAEVSGNSVKYTLTVKNESVSDDINNLTLIDKLPHSGDTYVFSDDARGSECDVKYAGDLQVKIGETTLSEDEYSVSYSSTGNAVFRESDQDWDGENGRVTWSGNNLDSTKLIRITLAKEVSQNETVTVTFNGTIDTLNSSKDSIVCNSFGYCYDSGAIANMAAESPKTTSVLKAEAQVNGSINVIKNYIDPSANQKEFYFTVYDGKYGDNTDKVVDTKSLILNGSADGSTVSANVSFTGLEIPTGVGITNTYYVYETDANGIPLVQNNNLGYRMCSEDNWVSEGEYCYVEVPITMAERAHTVSFTNKVPLPTVRITGPYVADVPIDYESANEENNTLESGMAVDGVIENPVDTNTVPDRKMKDIWDGSIKTQHDDGWGGDQGHTVATGFMAEITGSGTTLNNMIWKITSEPGNGNDVYVKIPEYTNGTKISGNTVEKVFNNDGDIYRITGDNPISMVLRLTLPTITLEDGSSVYVGVIIDQIYDKNATASVEINGEITEEQKQKMAEAISNADKSQGTLVNSPNLTDNFEN